GLGELARQYLAEWAMFERLSRRYDRQILEELLHLPPVDAGEAPDRAALDRWGNLLEARLNARGNGEAPVWRVSVSSDDDGLHGLLLQRSRHGAVATDELPLRFFDSAEYRRIAELATTLQGL